MKKLLKIERKFAANGAESTVGNGADDIIRQ